MYIKKVLCNEIKRCENCGKNVLFYRRKCQYCNKPNASETERAKIFDEAVMMDFVLLFAIPIIFVVLVISVIATFGFGFTRDVKYPISECVDIKRTTDEYEWCYVDVVSVAQGYSSSISYNKYAPSGLRGSAKDIYYIAKGTDEEEYIVIVSNYLVDEFENILSKNTDVSRIYGYKAAKLKKSDFMLGDSIVDEINKHEIIEFNDKIQKNGYFTKREKTIGAWLIWVDIFLLVVIVVLKNIRIRINIITKQMGIEDNEKFNE
ncbi:MAG: hypothetical protein IJC09_01295 [Clostridia bacterium]|nr:hypothetical protein [Clostridia bacterium]